MDGKPWARTDREDGDSSGITSIRDLANQTGTTQPMISKAAFIFEHARDLAEAVVGDACYAYYDGNGVELRLNRHDSQCIVYLEPEVMAALIAFWKDARRIELPDKRDRQSRKL